MDNHLSAVIQQRMEQTAKNLRKNNMETFLVQNKEEALETLKQLLKEEDQIMVGGSQTLFETGIIDFLKQGNYDYLDRYEEGLSREQINEIFIKAFSCDAYITSSNAITQNGELYNVDGNSNRVAAMLFGPKKVIVVAGYNKIVSNLDEAIKRVKTTASPANAKRLGIKSYCAEKGECVSLLGKPSAMIDGCNSENRICCNYCVCAWQRKKERIKVILIAQAFGY